MTDMFGGEKDKPGIVDLPDASMPT
jgi:hypothetical protein